MPDDPQLPRIEAAHKKIMEVFSEGYAFTIPAYQRPYAWETSHIEELLTDLKEAKAKSDGFYFLGSIVLVKSLGDPKADVVDGQQRLTTLTILFSVIRDLTESVTDQLRREEYVKQVANEDKGLKETLRLELRERDQDFFKKHVQTLGATNSLPATDGYFDTKARILENAGTIRKKLGEMNEAERTGLLKFLLQNCYLVVVEVPTQTDARRIFTVLNARGMDLLATDILKAYLLERAGAGNETQLSQRWEDIENALDRERFGDLFTHIRMIYERKKPDSALEDDFPKKVRVFQDDPLAFMDGVLRPYADAFTLSLDNDRITKLFGMETARLVRSLGRLDNNDWLPPLLLCLKQYNDGAPSCDVSEFIYRLERLAYCLFVTRTGVNRRISRYADVLNFLEPRNQQDSVTLEDSGLSLTREEAFDLFNGLHDNVYLVTRVVKPILLRLEHASTDGSAYYDHPTISVEHVCPQNIEKGSQWAEWFSEEEHNYWLHTLGNLVLLNSRKNSSAQNYDFENKKARYFPSGDASPFTITNEVREYETWTPDDIEARQYELLQRFAREWRLNEEFAKWMEADGE